ncbi:biorientation of chromosomes in cell division protein 1-like 1 [Dendronephthya gigantea]|uniref:biorientation of chromosomes in cell division protein 1-like 1 n=1 Tax=Dendronephthya gigantea TaxID=151771 RepID=UPI00106DBEED|nr:biorientation of chromosomes in cell division protein 1-like 1 [Dendronephthya gigantea]
MGDTGVTQRGSIMNYFQKEKSNDPLKTDKKIDENPIMVELKEDSVDSGDVSHPISMDKGDQKVMECVSSSDNKELDHCVRDQGDYHKDGKCNVRDVELEYAGEKCHSERKEKWNFSWKQGKTRKKVKTSAIDTSDSDQDFEMNPKSNGSKSSETEVKDITKSKTQGKKRINRTKASGHCVKPVIEILNPSDPEDGLKSLSDISQNTEAEILFINETNDKGFENESKKKNLDTRGEIEDVDIVKIKDSCKSLKTPKDRLENSKKNYFDVLMQSSKQKTLEKRKTESDTDNHNGDLDCSSSCKEGDRVDDSVKKGEKKGKKNRALRRKKDSIDDKDVGRKVDGENALLQPKKQTGNHSKGCKRDECSVNETAVRSSTRTRKKFVPTPEVIEDLNQEEAMDIPVVNEISSKPLTRKRALTAAKKVFAVEATVLISPDKQVQLEERKQDLLKEQVEKPELFQTSRHGNTESRMEKSIDTCDEDKDRKKGRNSKSTKPRRERRLRKSCILDSSDEEEQATESTVEAKPSPVETEDKKPRKVSGPIAPIFLPGAWRRAKSKLEEAEILEADKEIVEVKEDRSLQPIANAINSPVHCNSDIPIDDSSASLNAFLSMFKKPTTKASPVPVQFVEAPFPKISHVQQKDEANDMKWNLPIVWNRFVKEDYFFWPDGSGSVTERTMSLSFLKTDISCSEKKTKVLYRLYGLKLFFMKSFAIILPYLPFL